MGAGERERESREQFCMFAKNYSSGDLAGLPGISELSYPTEHFTISEDQGSVDRRDLWSSNSSIGKFSGLEILNCFVG